MALTGKLDVKPPTKLPETAKDPEAEKDSSKPEITVPVMLNLETMYNDLIHEPDFVNQHKGDGRHVKQAVLLQHGLDMSADSWFH